MKVLHINSYYSSSLFYKNFFDIQRKNGFNIDVFVPISSNSQLSNFDYGDYTHISKNHNKYDRLIFHLKHYKIFKDIQKNFNITDYSLIHAHSLFSNGYIALKLKKQYGIPYVVAVRNTDVNLFFKKMIYLRNLGVKILKESSNIIFLSSTYKNQVLQKYISRDLQKEIADKSMIIPNGIDDFWFQNRGKVKTITSKQNLKLLYVGQINKNKNILTTIKAIELLRKKGFDIKYTVVGKILDQNIYDDIKDLPYVTYIPPVTKEKLIKIYAENDIFVMPSFKESFGLVYAEAMSQGLPVIYSRGQGFDKQFDDGIIGYSVESNSEKEISSAIMKIIDRYETISQNAINHVNKFNWENILMDYKKIYYKLTLL